MALPGSNRQQWTDIFSCFLCDAEGFSSVEMEQHINLVHRTGSTGSNNGHAAEDVHNLCSLKIKDNCDDAVNRSHQSTLAGNKSVGKHSAEDHTESIEGGDKERESGTYYSPKREMRAESISENPETKSDNKVSCCVDGIGDDFKKSTTSLLPTDCSLNNDDCTTKVHDDSNINGVNFAMNWDVHDSSSDEESNLDLNLGTADNANRHHTPKCTAEKSTEKHHGARPKVKSTKFTHTSPQSDIDSKRLCETERMNSDGGPYSCPFCSFHTLFEMDIQLHVNQGHMKEDMSSDLMHYCPFCGDKFDTPGGLSQHINWKHPDGEIGCGTSQDWSAFSESFVSTPNTSGSSRHKTAVLKCPVCGLIWKDGNEISLSAHVSGHFTDPQECTDNDHQIALKLQKEENEQNQAEIKQFQTLQTQFGMDSTMTASKQYQRDLEHAVNTGKMTTSEFYERKATHAWSSRSGVDDGSTVVPCILEQLQKLYSGKSCPRSVAKAYLCSSTCHYSSSFGDKGWGCGYRNFQMLLSCLINHPTYFDVLFKGIAKIPSIQKLQQLIESAWQKGFDRQGCQQLGNSVVNSRKWIGATEIVATLSSLKIRCQLLDFTSPSGPENTHPVMFEWVENYFASSGDFRPPLYLQHQGHSRLIVGVEKLHKGHTNFLLFDPGVAKTRMELFHGTINHNLMQTMRKTIYAFRAKQYQIVAVVGILNDSEYQRSKTIRSTKMS